MRSALLGFSAQRKNDNARQCGLLSYLHDAQSPPARQLKYGAARELGKPRSRSNSDRGVSGRHVANADLTARMVECLGGLTMASEPDDLFQQILEPLVMPGTPPERPIPSYSSR